MEEDLCRRYLAALSALERGHPVQARREFELLTLEAPRFAPGWDGLGACCEAEGELRRAGECYRRAMGLDRRNWRSRFNWGVALHRAGDLRQAIRWLRDALKLAPQERRIHRWLGQCHFDLGDPAEALRCYRRALEQPERDVRDAELWTLIGRAEAERGDYEAAEHAYQRACLLSPDEAEVYHGWAQVTARQGDRSGADRLAARAVALDPRSLQYPLLRVRLAADAGDWEAAESRIRDLERHPGMERLAQALRAEAARRAGDTERARQLAIEALVMDGPLSDHAVDSALSTLRELRGLYTRCRGFRLLVQVRIGDSAYYRPYVVLAETEAQARAWVAELQEALDPSPWEVAEVEQFAQDGTVLAGVYQVLLTRVLFPLEDPLFHPADARA